MSQYARSSAILPVVVDHEDLDRVHDHRGRASVGAAERHVDLEHHRGLVRAHDDVARHQLDRLGHRASLIPERADALVADVRRLADRVVPHRVGREQVEAGLLVVAPVRVDVRVDDGPDRSGAIIVGSEAKTPSSASVAVQRRSGQRTRVPPARARLCITSGSSVTTTVCTASARANTRRAASRSPRRARRARRRAPTATGRPTTRRAVAVEH